MMHHVGVRQVCLACREATPEVAEARSLSDGSETEIESECGQIANSAYRNEIYTLGREYKIPNFVFFSKSRVQCVQE